MRRFAIALALVSMPLVGGCTLYIYGTEGHFRAQGLNRAAYELQCPQNQLTVTSLGGSQFGVSGCDKRAIYVWTGENWVNNTGVAQTK